MSTNFLDYAKFYNLLYKDYIGECKFIHELILKYHPNAKTILDVGCGTGMHANILKRDYGYEVTGVDLSHYMISIAKSNYAGISFSEGNARTFRLHQKFDVITSLFHVLSYQNTNEEVGSYFDNIKAHLKSTGIFIFDYWYGPAVLNLKPEARIKEMHDDHYKITRFASTNM
ncbi:MAG: class I SAM-dependent methyltransferase, partial [Bdellovibrionota bacterium]